MYINLFLYKLNNFYVKKHVCSIFLLERKYIQIASYTWTKDSFPSLQALLIVNPTPPLLLASYQLPRISHKTTRQTCDICETEEKRDREMAATSSCNFNWGVNGKGTPEQPCSSSKSSQILFSSNLSFCYSNIRYCLSLRSHQTLLSTRFNETKNSAFVSKKHFMFFVFWISPWLIFC